MFMVDGVKLQTCLRSLQLNYADHLIRQSKSQHGIHLLSSFSNILFLENWQIGHRLTSVNTPHYTTL